MIQSLLRVWAFDGNNILVFTSSWISNKDSIVTLFSDKVITVNIISNWTRHTYATHFEYCIKWVTHALAQLIKK